MLVVVLRQITVLAAAALLGAAPAAARVDRGGFDAVLNSTLAREWSWVTQSACGPESGEGRRVVRIRTSRPVRVGPEGGTLAIVGTLEQSGSSVRSDGAGGACVRRTQTCPVVRSAVTGSVRLTLRDGAVRLSGLRYRTRGRVGCAPEVPATRATLANQPRLESVVVRDRELKLRNPKIPRITVRASADPSAEIVGGTGGRVETATRWTLTLTRR